MKLSPEELVDIKYFHMLGAKNSDLAKAYNISRSSISNYTVSRINLLAIQFCKNNHDTFLCGREIDGGCKICTKISNKKYQAEHKDELSEYAYKKYRAHKNESRSYHLLRLYGLSLAKKVEMFNNQKGLCLGCDIVFENVHSACVDHDHETKKIRGLLCHSCNRGMGLLKDSSIRLRQLADYIDRYK